MISDTATRVQQHTAPHLNTNIQRETENRIAAFKNDDRISLINTRLNELDREWDVERLLQTNFAIASLVALALGIKVNKRWFALAAVIPAFMVQHALQGWCPPLAIFRRLGIRTSREINEERFALKSLRGDFDSITHTRDAETIVSAAKT